MPGGARRRYSSVHGLYTERLHTSPRLTLTHIFHYTNNRTYQKPPSSLIPSQSGDSFSSPEPSSISHDEQQKRSGSASLVIVIWRH